MPAKIRRVDYFYYFLDDKPGEGIEYRRRSPSLRKCI